ncbi:hypothetical protein LDL76_06000 [Salegentibacter mishustinae]|jgi:uncharacterized protein YejL (UPF0352 family)|uniref:hypothetical protein n=1 Tax=Salegentibacter mishustinae TaxID=270918 RepID=UPI001CE12736|nr:hypothetical protein [Salegentibacter mishustinae]UBZ08260.1 hypothetical protein LDL76_06000 [Salegentibacter mishustinae]
MNLKNEYPNYLRAINQMKDTTDLTLFRSNSKVLSHIMSYVVYGNKLADIYIDLNKHEDFIYISFSSYKGLTEKAKTTGERIYKDLSVEEWIGTIANVMNKHNANPRHAQLAINLTRNKIGSSQTHSVKNSGCIITLLLFFTPVASYFFLI